MFMTVKTTPLLRVLFLLTQLVGISTSIIAQIVFRPDEALMPHGTTSGIPVGIIDVNGDLLDDMVILDQGRLLCIYLQKGNGQFELDQRFELGLDVQWSLAAGHINEDRNLDLLIGGNMDGAKLLLTGMDAIQPVYLDSSEFFIQGSNMIDIDLDGDLDLLACNDDGLNQIWANDQGSFSPHCTYRLSNHASFRQFGQLFCYLVRC